VRTVFGSLRPNCCSFASVSDDEPTREKNDADANAEGVTAPAQAAPDSARATQSKADDGASRDEKADASEAHEDEESVDTGATDRPEETEPPSPPPEDAKTENRTDEQAKEASKRKPETWTNTLLWGAGILLVLGVELFVYGHDGYIQVCVGIKEITKFESRNEPKSKENARYHPFCAERMNLGMWTSSDEQSQDALKDACHAAARVVGMERKQDCIRNDDPWTRFVDIRQVMPWDPRLYRRLFWLE
jgi:hypothetical protein